MRTSTAPRRQALPLRLLSTSLAALFVLAGCGGGGGSAGTTVGSAPPSSQQPPPGTSPSIGLSAEDRDPSLLGDAYNNYWNMCAKPRTGVDASGKPFPDRQGTLLDELKFLRAWTHQYYLWFDEVPTTYPMASFTDPLDYFEVLKTSALTPSGKPKDNYHFTYPTAEWDAMQNQGVELGYGLTFSRNTGSKVPRTWLVAAIEPGSPAATAGLRRGDMLLRVDGVDFVSGDTQAAVDTINNGLFPSSAGEAHRFTFQRAGAQFEVTMVGADVVVDPVKNVKVIETASGKVGYLTFETHNGVSEKQLVDAFTTFKQEGVTDLVLDMRYNGGGLLYVASQLAYMIAGPQTTSGKVFERLQYNSKLGSSNPIMFRNTAYGFSSPDPIAAGTPLPYLGLKRVTVLTTSGSCSASEAVINGLRGADIEVIQIGGATCGKPYGFSPVPNCGTTYFSIEFKGVNNKGFGDYADGFAPTCQVSDDLLRPVGDPAEGLLAAALAYRSNRSCPAPSGQSSARQVPMQLVRPAIQEIRVFSPSR